MKKKIEMTVVKRLVLAFTAVLLLTLCIGLFSIKGMARMNALSDEMAKGWSPSLQATLEIRAALARCRAVTFAHIVSTDVSGKKNYEKRFSDYLEKINSSQKSYLNFAESAQQRKSMNDFANHFESYKNSVSEVMILSRAEKSEEATLLAQGRSLTLFNELDEKLDTMVQESVTGNVLAAKRIDDAYKAVSGAVGIMLIVTLVVGVSAAIFTTRVLSRQLGGEPAYAAAIAQGIAKGDLSGDIVTTPGDNSSLIYAMRGMSDSLIHIVSGVRQDTFAIATITAEIAAATVDLSARTEQQASSLEETAATLEQMTGTLRQNAKNAIAANELANNASALADEGGKAMQNVVAMMKSISSSSAQIVDIISVIDGIAFQTNILALNAAVEAARAGEQGRGFAVVASEVRNLAQRSAGAAREIKDLIDDSVSKISTGADMVEEAGGTMGNIVHSVRQVAGLISEISGATQEQSIGIEQINEAVSQIEQVTQKNAGLVGDGTQATQNLRGLTERLNTNLEFFRIRTRDETRSMQALLPAPEVKRLAA